MTLRLSIITSACPVQIEGDYIADGGFQEYFGFRSRHDNWTMGFANVWEEVWSVALDQPQYYGTVPNASWLDEFGAVLLVLGFVKDRMAQMRPAIGAAAEAYHARMTALLEKKGGLTTPDGPS